jgi:ATP-binding cassette subfamily B (MDR/TAP) protein 1
VTITSVRGDIDFQKVCFKYPLRPNVQIFKDLSLRIPSGKVIFFCWNLDITYIFHLMYI